MRHLVTGLRRGWPWGVALVATLLAGEIAARLDDWLFHDVPLLASPDRERDLVVHDAMGIRGRPEGAFRKWRLNAFGFRGPEITEKPAPGVRRVMVLGASESFGLFENAGHEYPALLQEQLRKNGYGSVEVVNAAVAGMTLPSLLGYWEKWASRFEPEVVLIYPSPHFYLDTEAPRPAAPRTPETESARPMRSRFAERLVDTAKKIEILKSLRVRSVGIRDDAFRTVPEDRLAQYVNDLEKLADAVAARGGIPVLVTHAFKTPSPPEAQDRAELDYLRIFVPRATVEVLPAFDQAARDATRVLGQRRGWTVIDAAGTLNGRREWFGDPVHFNDRGSAEMATLLARALPMILTMPVGGR